MSPRPQPPLNPSQSPASVPHFCPVTQAGRGAGLEGHIVKGAGTTVLAGLSLGREGRGLRVHGALLPPPQPQSGSPQQGTQAQVGVRHWQDKQSLVLGVVPSLPRREAGDWLPAMFAPQAECVGGRKSRGFGVWTRTSHSWALWVGRARWDLKLPRLIQTCSLWDTPGQVEWGVGGQGRLPAAQMQGAGELEPQQDRHCGVPTPRTDFVPQPVSDPVRRGLKDTWSSHSPSLGLSFPSCSIRSWPAWSLRGIPSSFLPVMS